MQLIVLIDLSSELIGIAVKELLCKFAPELRTLLLSETRGKVVRPDLLLADHLSLQRRRAGPAGAAKVILLDMGLIRETSLSFISSYRVRGIISSRTDIPLFCKALRVIHGGQVWIENEVMRTLLEQGDHALAHGADGEITSAERRVIEGVRQGMRNKEIATLLRVSEPTIKAHLHRIFQKLRVTSRTQLLARDAVTSGWNGEHPER